MKRKLLCILLCLALFFSCLAVDAFAAKQSSEAVDWGLTLMPDHITSTGMVVVVSQSGGRYEGSLQYGRSYTIEVLKDDVWESVPVLPDSGYWTMEAYILPEESIERMELNWENIYGSLSAGHYRLVKEFFDYQEGAPDYKNVVFYAEFVITDSHLCVSEDGDLLCDVCFGLAPHDCVDSNGDTQCEICGEKISDRDVFHVVGNSERFGHMGSNLGLMAETEPGVYQKTFLDMQPGTYKLAVVKNWDTLDYFHGDGVITYTVERRSDLTVRFMLGSDGNGEISVTEVPAADPNDPEIREEIPKTLDWNVKMPALFLLCCMAAFLWLVQKKTDIV